MTNLLLTVSPGRLGLTIKVYKNDPQNGAVITEIDPACTFKNQLEIGDRIVTIDGLKVTKIEDLSLNKDRLRKFGIVKKKNQVAAADGREVSRENVTTATSTSATAVKAATEQLQQQQAMKQQYLIRTQQEQRAAKQQQNEKIEIPKHPMMGLSRRVNGNYNIVNQHENLKNIPKTQVISRLQTFIESLSQMKCISNRSRLHISCTCMQFLKNKPRLQLAMCHAILEYSDMTHVQKKHHVVERMRYAKMVSRKAEGDSNRIVEQLYGLPLSYEYLENNNDMECDDAAAASSAANADAQVDDDSSHPSSYQEQQQQQQLSEAFSHRICASAFFRLHSIGPHAEKIHKQYIGGDLSIITHQNAGKKRKRKTTDAMNDLRSSLQALYDEYINSSECKRKGDDFTLPVNISKRNYYEEWCRKRGWEPSKTDTANGQYAKVVDFELLDGYYRTEEEESLAEAEGRYVVGVAKRVVAFTNFMYCWNNEFPNMKTQGRVGKGMFIGERYGSGKWDRNR
eukprot:scaffold10192_cov121-Skeletonema_dohrnii-CCMP3373.AAC.1